LYAAGTVLPKSFQLVPFGQTQGAHLFHGQCDEPLALDRSDAAFLFSNQFCFYLSLQLLRNALSLLAEAHQGLAATGGGVWAIPPLHDAELL
jgi:hypothetical protein